MDLIEISDKTKCIVRLNNKRFVCWSMCLSVIRAKVTAVDERIPINPYSSIHENAKTLKREGKLQEALYSAYSSESPSFIVSASRKKISEHCHNSVTESCCPCTQDLTRNTSCVLVIDRRTSSYQIIHDPKRKDTSNDAPYKNSVLIIKRCYMAAVTDWCCTQMSVVSIFAEVRWRVNVSRLSK